MSSINTRNWAPSDFVLGRLWGRCNGNRDQQCVLRLDKRQFQFSILDINIAIYLYFWLRISDINDESNVRWCHVLCNVIRVVCGWCCCCCCAASNTVNCRCANRWNKQMNLSSQKITRSIRNYHINAWLYIVHIHARRSAQQFVSHTQRHTPTYIPIRGRAATKYWTRS